MSLDQMVAVSGWMIVPLVLLGGLLHFVFDWTGHHRVAAVFGAVNESYWEHVKIAVWPVLLLQMVLFAAGGHRHAAFVPAATVALYSIPVGMVGLVFLYKAVTGRNVLWLDLLVFAAVIVLAQVIFVQFVQHLEATGTMVALAVAYLLGLVVAFLRFTIHPPREPDVFIDPITGGYGLGGHPDLGDRT